MNDAAQAVEAYNYVDLAGVAYSASLGQIGALNTNYSRTTYQYDHLGILT